MKDKVISETSRSQIIGDSETAVDVGPGNHLKDARAVAIEGRQQRLLVTQCSVGEAWQIRNPRRQIRYQLKSHNCLLGSLFEHWANLQADNHAKRNFVLFRTIWEAHLRHLVGIRREDYGCSARRAATNYSLRK
jgi:hypothetical protein